MKSVAAVDLTLLVQISACFKDDCMYQHKKELFLILQSNGALQDPVSSQWSDNQGFLHLIFQFNLKGLQDNIKNMISTYSYLQCLYFQFLKLRRGRRDHWLTVLAEVPMLYSLLDDKFKKAPSTPASPSKRDWWLMLILVLMITLKPSWLILQDTLLHLYKKQRVLRIRAASNNFTSPGLSNMPNTLKEKTLWVWPIWSLMWSWNFLHSGNQFIG